MSGTEEDLEVSKCQNSFWNLIDAAKLSSAFQTSVCVHTCVFTHIEGPCKEGQSGWCYRRHMGSLGVCWGRNNPSFLTLALVLRSGPGVLWDVQGRAGLSGSLLLHLFSASRLTGWAEHPPKYQATPSSKNKHFIQILYLCFCLPCGHFAVGWG